MVFFHNPNEKNGYLSNWYMSKFVYNSVEFSSMEQYMMYSKALLFNDVEIAKLIMHTHDVARIKELGRAVRGFNNDVWTINRVRIVKEGLYAKFMQNDRLRERLLSTGNEILAECAVRDKIWGIGLSMKDERRFDTSKWRGENLLGICLMEVRDDIIRSQ